MKLTPEIQSQLIELQKSRGISLEGNICKILESEEGTDFDLYLKECINRDKDNNRKRLKITKDIQKQNQQLVLSKGKNEELMKELKETLKLAEDAKDSALSDLDIIQRKQQTKLISTIVKTALYIIVGVGITTTVMYMFSIMMNKDTQMIGSTWSNMFGILLTNAFSIVGTIMGVKYASKNDSED